MLKTVRDSEGQVAQLIETRADKAVLELESGETLVVDGGVLRESTDGYTLPFSFRQARNAAGEAATVPVIEETAEVGKRRVESGGVRLTKTVSEREEVIDEPLLKEDVSVERVSVNRVLEEPATIRSEGDTTVIPVLEEVLVVEKRLMLKEELHVKKQRTQTREPQSVTLRSERVEVEELKPGRKETE